MAVDLTLTSVGDKFPSGPPLKSMRTFTAQRLRVLAEISPGCLRQAHAEIFALPWLIVAGPSGHLETSFCSGLSSIRACFGSRMFPDIARELVLKAIDARLVRTPAFAAGLGHEFTLQARGTRLRRRMQDASRVAVNDFGALGLLALADGLDLDAYAPATLVAGGWEEAWRTAHRQKQEIDALLASSTGNELAELLSMEISSAHLFDGGWRLGRGDWIKSLPDAALPKKVLKKALNYLRSQPWALAHRPDGTFEIEPGPMFTAYAERPHTSTETDTARSIAATVMLAAVARINWIIKSTAETTWRCPNRTREMICDRLVAATKAYGLRGMVMELSFPTGFA